MGVGSQEQNKPGATYKNNKLTTTTFLHFKFKLTEEITFVFFVFFGKYYIIALEISTAAL